MKNKMTGLGLCLMLAALPLLASCAGIGRVTGFVAEPGGEHYLKRDTQWEGILGCKAEVFNVTQPKNRSTPDYLLRRYLYARCGDSIFVYGDFKHSMILNIATGEGVVMDRRVSGSFAEIFPIAFPKPFTKAFLQKFAAGQIEETELRQLLDRSNYQTRWITKDPLMVNASQGNMISIGSQYTHLFYAAYVDTEFVQKERYIAEVVAQFKSKKLSIADETVKFQADFFSWDIRRDTPLLSLLARLYKEIQADPPKLYDLVRVVHNNYKTLNKAWAQALKVDRRGK